MNVELSGKTEKIEPYRFFGEGRVVDLMSRLVKAGYNPAGVGTILDRRMNAPEDVRSAWQLNYFWTGDSAGTDNTGNVVLTLDSSILRELNPNSPLSNTYALNLSAEQWEELSDDKESLHLSPSFVEQVQRQGYVKKNGVWQPTNSEVGKVWDFLMQGKDVDLKEYAQMVSGKSGYDSVMRLYFDQSRPSTPNWRSVVVSGPDDDSGVLGTLNLDDGNGRLAGVAPEAHRFRQAEGTRENLGVDQPTANEIADVIYGHLVDITKSVTKEDLLQGLKNKGYK
ncbi:MAG: hypothetical protein ABIG52_02940 [Nanoarchaeota archaeon]